MVAVPIHSMGCANLTTPLEAHRLCGCACHRHQRRKLPRFQSTANEEFGKGGDLG